MSFGVCAGSVQICHTELDSVYDLAMAPVEAIPIPLPHIGSVNAWLVRGDPLTIVDTGPRSDRALDALERGLRLRGVEVEDIELVLATHHHHDHVGLAATIKRRAGARIAALELAADYGARFQDNVARDRRFSRRLMKDHGVPEALFAATEALWDYIAATAENFDVDVRLKDGDHIRAGGRELRVVARPGHSGTDTLFIDAKERFAFVGDHLLANISPNTEIYERADASRSRPRIDYLNGLRRTARMPLERLLPGHGPSVCAAREIVARQLAQHRERCKRIIRILERGRTSAFAIGQAMWREAIVDEQPLLVISEVLGHLDLMLAAGIVEEGVDDDGRWSYSLARSEGCDRGAQHLVHSS